jgi:hypothetical protein
VADDGEIPRTSKRAELARRSAEIEQLEPFLELAREIKLEVDRVAADDAAGAESLTEVIERIPRLERQRIAQLVFDQLPAEDQWSVLERVFGDAELREYLSAERDRRLSELHSSEGLREVARAARAARELDTRMIPDDVQVTLGLFREADARAAVSRGHVSQTCVRQLVLRSRRPGELHVIEDVFNPRGGYFVTRDYDQGTWERERLASHAIVRVGALRERPEDQQFEPVLYPGGRADFETDQGVVRGRLHLGFVMLGDVDVFAG